MSKLLRFRLMVTWILVLFFVTTAASAQTFTELFKFPNGSSGNSPGALLNANGAFFGATAMGGKSSNGTVFELTSQGKETTLYTFPGGVNGSAPTISPLIRDQAGNFYGTASYGGDLNCNYEFNKHGCGVVYKLSPTGQQTILHSFSGGADGALPYGGLVADALGNLYGATYEGGTACSSTGCGTVYKITPAGTETVLHSFAGGSDGAGPYYVDLIIDPQGNLYGTTLGGGTLHGTIFKIDHTGKETLLYRFSGGADGSGPFSGLVRDSHGNLYGATSEGGELTCNASGAGCGVVFKLDPSGHETVLYSFQTYGGFISNLILDPAGNLYGTSEEGGSGQVGTVFEVSNQGQYSVLYNFSGFGSDGEFPMAGLVRDKAGNLFGTTTGGGEGPCNDEGCGVIFKLTP